MTFEDWRDADDRTVEALVAAERDRWLLALRWDTGASWAIVDEGRRRGHVPGWILRERSGAVAGWTYYLLHEGELQIGALSAPRATDLRRLLDRVLDAPEASLASTVSAFVFPAPPPLLSALTRRRFAVRRSLYLSRTLDAAAPAVDPPLPRVRPFAGRDLFPAVRLLAAAYQGVAGAECFAAHGRPDEWARYLRQLVETPACGRWLADASFVVADDTGDRLRGLVLTTAVSGTTAHIAQLVVAREVRGQGVADALIDRAGRAAAVSGHTAMTLMVDEGNAAARRLYARQRFVETSAFVAARRRGQVRMPNLTPL
jgi:ribosomal protein S18 acetylase RimI-like enzyme